MPSKQDDSARVLDRFEVSGSVRESCSRGASFARRWNKRIHTRDEVVKHRKGTTTVSSESKMGTYLKDIPADALLKMLRYAIRPFVDDDGKLCLPVSAPPADSPRRHGLVYLAEVMHPLRDASVEYVEELVLKGHERCSSEDMKILLAAYGPRCSYLVLEGLFNRRMHCSTAKI